MIKEDFQIGLEFYTASGKWRCTDIGTRVIVAIKLDQDDLRNYNIDLIESTKNKKSSTLNP